MNTALYLYPDVHFCECDGALILLHAEADSYLRFSPTQAAWFTQIRSGLTPDSPEPAVKFSEALIRRRILTLDPERGKPLLPEPQGLPLADYMSSLPEDFPIRANHIRNFLYAATSSAIAERKHDLTGVLNVARAWQHAAKRRRSVNADALVDLAHIFHRLSPLVFSSKDACRYRSLCLLKFATLYGLRPNWVFGVRLSPFMAHCWIEAGGYALNDDPRNIQEYRRIMTV